MDLLEKFVTASNGLIDHLTDPAVWTSPSGEINIDERNIAWPSARFGIGAIAQMGEEWHSEEMIWTAFRAIGILQGIWEGGRQKPKLLDEMLKPDVIRRHALSHIPNVVLRDWYGEVIDYHEEALFGIDRSVDVATRTVRELRNLVHGTGSRAHDRAARIRALEIATQPGLRFLKDVAACWWTAAICSPTTHCVPGESPIRSGQRPKHPETCHPSPLILVRHMHRSSSILFHN